MENEPVYKELICEYCKKTFCRLNALQRHKRTVASCIKIQEESGKIVKKIEYICPNQTCKKKSSSHSSFQYHVLHCKLNNKFISEQKDDENLIIKQTLNEQNKKIELLNKKIEELHKYSTINNITNNSNNSTTYITIQNWMTEERVIEIFQKHIKSIDDFSPKNLATFTATHLVNGLNRPLYICTDPSRQRMIYVDSSGNKQVDKNCSLLIEHVLKAKPFVDQVIQEHITYETQEEINRVKPLHNTFSNLHHSRNYQIELSRQLPQTEECARNKPLYIIENNGVDWEINDKIREKETMHNKVVISDINNDFFTQDSYYDD